MIRIPPSSCASPSHTLHCGLATLFYLVVLAPLGQTLPLVSQRWWQYLRVSDTDLLPRPHPAWNAVAMERHQQACVIFGQHKLEDCSSSRSPGSDMPGCGLGVGQGNSGASHDSPGLESSQLAPPSPSSTEPLLLPTTVDSLDSLLGKLRPVPLPLPQFLLSPTNGWVSQPQIFSHCSLKT